MHMQRITSGMAGNGLYTTIKYMRGAAVIGLGTTIKYLRRTTSGTAGSGDAQRAPSRTTAGAPRCRREQWPEHHDHLPL
jgi:hypothetical protein